MFNIGGGEIALILIVALLLLGPQKLPELARGIGKFMREFRRQTDDVRNMVEREFYAMDQEIQREEAPPKAVPASVQRPAADGTAEGGPTSAAGGENAAAPGSSENAAAPGSGENAAAPGSGESAAVGPDASAVALGGGRTDGAIGNSPSASDPSQELFDARYHEMEANGLLPAESPLTDSSADPAHHQEASSAPTDATKQTHQQEPAPRGK